MKGGVIKNKLKYTKLPLKDRFSKAVKEELGNTQHDWITACYKALFYGKQVDCSVSKLCTAPCPKLLITDHIA